MVWSDHAFRGGTLTSRDPEIKADWAALNRDVEQRAERLAEEAQQKRNVAKICRQESKKREASIWHARALYVERFRDLLLQELRDPECEYPATLVRTAD